MKMNKKKVITIASVATAVILAVGGTLAYLQDTSDEKVNTFEKSSISVDLTETQHGPYKIIPGESDPKNPTVIASTPDVDAFVFVKVTDETEDLVNYRIADGWNALPGEEGVYYREAAASDTDYEFPVLAGDKVSYNSALTVDDMGDLDVDAQLTFQSFIIQKAPFNDAAKAWKALTPATASTADELAAALADGGHVILTEDITTNAPIEINDAAVLDLNGHKIQGSGADVISIGPNGDLMIMGDGEIAGPENGENFDSNAIVTVDGGNLTMESGVINATGEGSDGMYGVYVLNGGSAIFGKEDGTGPSIHSHFAAIGSNNTTAPVDIQILGGEYTADAAPTNNEWWSYFCAPIYAAANGTYDIQGGTFNGYYGLSSRYQDTDQDIILDDDVVINASSGTDIFVDSKKGSTNTPDRHIISKDNSLTLPAGYSWVASGDAYEVQK